MSKVFSFLTLLLVSLILYPTLLMPKVRAQSLPNCSMRTDPLSILSNTPLAKFIVNVGKNTNYSSYKMEFQCGAPQGKGTASLEGDSEIYREFQNSGSDCKFDPGSHTIKVFAVTDKGEVAQCIASYPVINANTQCRLSINPSSGITSSTSSTVSGENLTSGGKFVLFFDDDAVDIPNNPAGRALIDIPGAGNVDTPSFSPKSIPQELMTPGTHVISLRQRANTSDWFNPLKQEKDFFGSPLCPLSFTVGTPDKPGSVLTPGAPRPAGTPASSFGDWAKCDGGSADPGIKTAIGCIHTSPIGFVKDMLKFVVGISGGLAFLMMLLGAFQMITSAGNPDTLSAGRERFTSAVIGLLFVIFSVLLLQIIGVDILGILKK